MPCRCCNLGRTLGTDVLIGCGCSGSRWSRGGNRMDDVDAGRENADTDRAVLCFCHGLVICLNRISCAPLM